MRTRRDFEQPQKLKLIRPSSGFFGYNSKRTDSDTELGRFLSNNVRILSLIEIPLGMFERLFIRLLFYYHLRRAFHPAAQKVV